MRWTRRWVLLAGGGGLATLAIPRLPGAAATEVIEMRGTPRGERVWFAPLGLAVAPGTTLHFINKDAGNSHTSTAYHPDLYDRPHRIPAGAAPWDSGFLMPGESFEVKLEQPGVYDYYCLPHEMAGMVGRIVVGRPDGAGWEEAGGDAGALPAAALAALPPVEEILAATRIDVERSR